MTEGLVRVTERRALRTSWVGSLKKCFAMGDRKESTGVSPRGKS